MTTKVCTKCGQEKPVECFYKRSSKGDATEGGCKACKLAGVDKAKMAASSRAHYLRNQTTIRQRTRLHKQANPWRGATYAKRARDEMRPGYIRYVAHRLGATEAEAELRVLQRRTATFFQMQSITKLTSCKTQNT